VVPGSVVLDVDGGTLSALTWNVGNTSATATFTADQDSVADGSVQVVSFTDVVGNAGTGDTATIPVDTRNPTIHVTNTDASLNDGNPSSEVTFSFSEAVVPGSVVLDVDGGTLSALTWNVGNTSATATFTADQDSVADGSVQVVSFTDVVGNAGTGDTATIPVDTRNPTVDVTITDASLNDGNPSSEVTFSFSEAVVPGSVVLDVEGGTLSALHWHVGNTCATATFTADQ